MRREPENAVTRVPDLPPRCGSWIAYRESVGAVELFSRKNAEYAAANGYEVYTALDWLARVNAAIKQGDG